MHLNWQIKHYVDLTTNEFHDIIALRLNAFVATARILPPGLSYKEECAIGRVVIDENIRGKGIGHELMDKSVDFAKVEFGGAPIKISAQKHLENYYNQHQFKSTGNEYLEDGIPHVEMILNIN